MTTTPPPPPNHQGAGHGSSVPHDTFAGERPATGQGPTMNGQPHSGSQAFGGQQAGASAHGGPGGHSADTAGGHYAPPQNSASDSDKMVGMFCHLSGIIAFVLSGGWLPFLGPLLVWALYKDKDPFVRRAAAGSFNFHVVVTVVAWALWIITLVTLFLAAPLTLLVAAVGVVLYLWWTISATLKASRGEPYTYPIEWKILT